MTPPPIRVAILGCAHVPHARSYARAVAGGTAGELVAVQDPSLELAQLVAGPYDVPVETDPSVMLRRFRPDAVIVCSATDEHAELIALAAAHGAHCLSEKPLATSVDDAARIVSSCDEAGVQLHTAFVCRFYPEVIAFREVIRSGGLGEIRGMVGGNRGRPPLAPQYPAWITDSSRSGGGALIDHSVHVLDAMRFVSGLEVATVYAESGTLFNDIDVDDAAVVDLTFSNGAIGAIDPSWSVRPGNPWDYDFYLRVLGTDGHLSFASIPESVRVSGRLSGRSYELASFEPDVDRSQVDSFIGSVRAGEPLDPSASGTDGAKAVEVALAAYRASSTGQPVELSARG
jgi:predicted dehydrogenase